MFRLFALVAAVGMAGLSVGTANAHPPDLYGSSYASGYGTSYTPSYSSHNPGYYGSSTYSQPTYSQPIYSAPSYSGVSYGSSYNAPAYTPGYAAPAYGTSGYSAPSYGYRHRAKRRYHRGAPGYARNPYSNYPVTAYSHRSFGPYADIPTTEGLNVGYAGGPTFGTDQNPVINGVRLNAAPN